MRQRVTVKEVLPDGRAIIFLRRESACSGECEHCGGCTPNETVTAEAANPVGAKKGDTVEVETESGIVLAVIAVVYLVPLLLFFAGYFAGLSLPGKPILWGLLGFAAGIAAAVLYNRHMVRTAKMTYRIVTIREN